MVLLVGRVTTEIPALMDRKVKSARRDPKENKESLVSVSKETLVMSVCQDCLVMTERKDGEVWYFMFLY